MARVKYKVVESFDPAKDYGIGITAKSLNAFNIWRKEESLSQKRSHQHVNQTRLSLN